MIDDAVARSLARKFATTDRPPPWQFVLYGGIGDHVLWLSLLYSFRRRTTRAVVVYCDELTADLVRLYAGRSFDRMVEIEALDGKEVELLRARQRFEPGHPLLAWHMNFVGGELTYLAGQDRSIADLIRQLLRLPSDAPLAPPIWPRATRTAAAAHMRRLGLPPGRTILIAPWARSASATLPVRWWIELARACEARGFVVATNVGSRARGFDRLGIGVDLAALPGTVAADVPLGELGPFVERCGAVMCVRSGLSDLLAFSNVRMCVWSGRMRWDARSSFGSCSRYGRWRGSMVGAALSRCMRRCRRRSIRRCCRGGWRMAGSEPGHDGGMSPGHDKGIQAGPRPKPARPAYSAIGIAFRVDSPVAAASSGSERRIASISFCLPTGLATKSFIPASRHA
jgi:hypothetical protein